MKIVATVHLPKWHLVCVHVYGISILYLCCVIFPIAFGSWHPVINLLYHKISQSDLRQLVSLVEVFLYAILVSLL